MITDENWTSSYYKSPKLRAFISLGGDPRLGEDPTIYILSLTDHEYKEVFSQDLRDLSSAVAEINRRYSHWEFVDSSKSEEGGCGSCQAH